MGVTSENFKDDSIKANNATNQSNFAGTKYWSGGSNKISNYAGAYSRKDYASANMSGTDGSATPSRHPEGVKGGNSNKAGC